MRILKPPLGTQLNLGHWSTNGLIAHYAMNEGGGDLVSDMSKNGINGNITGAEW